MTLESESGVEVSYIFLAFQHGIVWVCGVTWRSLRGTYMAYTRHAEVPTDGYSTSNGSGIGTMPLLCMREWEHGA